MSVSRGTRIAWGGRRGPARRLVDPLVQDFEKRLAVALELDRTDPRDLEHLAPVERHRSAISRNVESWNTTYAGMPRASASSLRRVRNRSKIATASGVARSGLTDSRRDTA